MEFYKAAPWPLSFLSGYQFKLQLDKYKEEDPVKKILAQSSNAWVSGADIKEYKLSLADAPHAKTRALIRKLFKTRSEELLWVPPSLPHYPLVGSFEGQQDFSKTLLFSSWAIVPRALSGLISYEAERRVLLNRRNVDKSYYKTIKHSPRIKFDAKSSMVGWSLVYPSQVLREVNLNENTKLPSLDDLLKQRIKVFKKYLQKLSCYQEGARSGDRWFALAPMLLDLKSEYNDYLEKWLDWQEFVLDSNDYKGRQAQFTLLRTYLDDDALRLGPMPSNLAEYLAYLSVSGPAVAIARTWHRNFPKEKEENVTFAATEVAFSVVSMFNKPESENILDKRYKKLKYFQAIVHYCADGDFQAVIDEYGHLLQDSGLPMYSTLKGSKYTATSRLVAVMSFMTTNVACQFSRHRKESSDDLTIKAGKDNNQHTLRCHYAVPLGNQKISNEQDMQRISNVRDAFNSPFRPFMLNSTSIGQEGLDFHWYCHNVVHWNLPGNPIDIEQREGRVNRYKSLVVRKRLAEGYKQEVVYNGNDYWSQLFDKVDAITKKEGRNSDLVPYWHIPNGSTKIERFIPLLPMSKDVSKLNYMLKILVIYRLAFGQARQEELFENLLSRSFSPDDIKLINQNLVINLSPLMHTEKK